METSLSDPGPVIGVLTLVNLRGATGASRLLLAAAMLTNAAVILTVAAFEFSRNPGRLWYLIAFVAAASALEYGFRRMSGREMQQRG